MKTQLNEIKIREFRKMKWVRIFYVLMLIAMCSCDAIRVVQVTNISNNPIEIRTDFPHRIEMEKDSNGIYQVKLIPANDRMIMGRYNNLQVDTVSEDLIIKLQPNQSFEIAGNIGPALVKISTWDLNHSRLSIFTLTDTIIAKDKNEIIDLLNNPKTKYTKKTDKERIKLNNKYWRNIVIRE